jgi:hypothetical protein
MTARNAPTTLVIPAVSLALSFLQAGLVKL